MASAYIKAIEPPPPPPVTVVLEMTPFEAHLVKFALGNALATLSDNGKYKVGAQKEAYTHIQALNMEVFRAGGRSDYIYEWLRGYIDVPRDIGPAKPRDAHLTV